MKILFAILIVVLVAAFIFADYKWREWMAARKAQRNGAIVGNPNHRDRQ